MGERLPTIFIAGAQKCGTTSLHGLVGSHPAVFFPRAPQELHFFDDERNFARGTRWYAAHFRDAPPDALLAQTSPFYLYHADAPRRMADLMPNARSLFVLRDPVARAYSHYWHQVRYGWEALDFEAALDAEPERIARGGEHRRHFSYVDRGRYAEQLERFASYFGRERMLVLGLDELRRRDDALRERLGAFLGIDPAGFGAGPSAPIDANAAKLPRVRLVQRVTLPLRRVAPRVVDQLDRLNLVERRYPPMAEETRARLERTFAGEVERVRADWGVDLTAG